MMPLSPSFVALTAGVLGLASAAPFASNSSSNNTAATGPSTVKVHWLDGTPKYNTGTTFGVPWPRGAYPANTTVFTGQTDGGDQTELQSWITGYWPDGSVKWSAHAVPAADTYPDGYSVTATPTKGGASSGPKGGLLTVTQANNEVVVDTGKLTATFSTKDNVIVKKLVTAGGKTIGANGRLVLRTQTSIDDDYSEAHDVKHTTFESKISTVTVDNSGSVRALVTVNGTHTHKGGAEHKDWLPFTVRFYLYSNSDAIRVIHTIVYDGETDKDFIAGLGLKFEVPLAGEDLYDRHVRFTSADGGVLHESVQGVTGLRRDPGANVRTAQVDGAELPDASTWDQRVTTRLHWIPPWGDYSLSQLTPDGATLKKRTKSGQGWINIPAGGRAGGLAYLGGATKGGLAVALRDFWKRYPTGLDINNAEKDTGELTVWLYSPAAQPLDLRPFHDGLGQEGNYTAQLDALEITYEDWQEGYNTPYGIARTNELYIYAFDETPAADTLVALNQHAEAAPVLAADSAYIQSTAALGTYWDQGAGSTTSAIESNLEFLYQYYEAQIVDRKWYGFFDYGDVMHAYDPDRHTWRYDVGGYAWDNSELSPNIFFWLYYLRTGRGDIYRFSEAHTRHTGEVDVYHIGKWKGVGTRHGVQHWGDSAKQIRISTPQYRKVYYYVSGGDERTGEIIHETMDADQAFVTVDPRRKVRPNKDYVPDPTALDISLGTDWSGLAAVWLLEWERRGPRWQEARTKLYETVKGIANLKNGFVTGTGLYNLYTGVLTPPGADPDNQGVVDVSHLSAVFGLLEVVSEVIESFGEDLPEGFEQAWLDYCYYYNAGAAEQTARYGKSFGNVSLKQGHSRLTAYAANKTENATLAARAWREFYSSDGFKESQVWSQEVINGSAVFNAVREAAWLDTNTAALYGVAAIENLALIKKWLP